MKLTMLGGGGFRTPLVYRSLTRRAADAPAEPLIDHVALYDIDAVRLQVIERVLDQLPGTGPTVSVHTDLDAALEGADFVFSAIRVGGLAGRVADERVALDLGVLGQETTGPGGVAFGLRTIPQALRVAAAIKRCCPSAWVINFTNPAGMITEAMQRILGDRVIGICDSPMGLARRARRALGLAPSRSGDYAGLNHLGWLTSIDDDGSDRLPELLADTDRLLSFEEGQVFGPARLRELGAIPNEYLYYYWHTAAAIAASTEQTRGEYLLLQQRDFYTQVAAAPTRAYAAWETTKAERNESYMVDARRGYDRDDDDIDDGGYEEVAVDVMTAIAYDQPTELIVNVANRGAIANLGAYQVVEVPCIVAGNGATPLGTGRRLTADVDGLVERIKLVETLAINAALSGSVQLARDAFAAHPLVESDAVARQLFDGYRTRIAEFAAVFA